MAQQQTDFVDVDGGEINIILAIGFALLLACSNGANDIANSVGTAVGAGAVTLNMALLIGSASELSGAVLMGAEVAKTIGSGVVRVDEAYDADNDLLAIAMTSVLAGAGISTALATAFGLPVSATHGVISGLAAVAMFERGSGAIDGGTLAMTVAGWIISPLVGALVAGGVSISIEKLIFSTANPAIAAHTTRPGFVAATVGLVVAFLCSKGPVWIRLPWWGVLLVTAVCAAGAGGAIRHAYGEVPVHFARLTKSGRVSTAPEDATEQEQESWLLAQEGIEGAAGVVDAAEKGGEDDELDVDVAEAQFKQLLVLTGCTVAFAHGGNDVGNATGPLGIALRNSAQTGFVVDLQSNDLLLPAIGGLCFVVGIVTVGSRTIATVGSKITKLTNTSAFAVQSGATLAVLLSSAAGLPVSTSHCLVGALIGVGIAGRFSPTAQAAGRVAPLDFSVLKKIMLAWVVTIPLAVVLALAVYVPLRAALSQAAVVAGGSGSGGLGG
jgi:phosphate/sulfate permease